MRVTAKPKTKIIDGHRFYKNAPWPTGQRAFGFGFKCRPWRNFHGFDDPIHGARCRCKMFRLVQKGGWEITPDRRPI